MKKKQKVFLVFTLFAILLACEQEYPFNSFKATKRDLQSEVDRVRQWYEQNKPGLVQTKSGVEDELSIMMAPNWSESFLREDENYETVEVAAAMNKRVTYMTPEVRARYVSTKEVVYKQDMRRFVFLTDKKTNKMNCFVMLIVPDLFYLEKSDFKPFYKNTYLERASDFSGYILYYELDGTFANGWRYENGELRQTVTETPYRYRGSRPEPIRTRSVDCSEVEMHILIEECTDHFTYVEYDGITSELNYSHTTCVYYDEVTGSYLRCEDNTGRYEGGGGGYQPPTDPVDPAMGEMKGLYSTSSTLTDTEKERLRGSYEGLCGLKPTIEAMCKSLIEKDVKIIFTTGSTLNNSPAEYQGGVIRFSSVDKITSSALEEELIHAYQHKVLNQRWDMTYKNVEFEAKLFRDLTSVLDGYSISNNISTGLEDTGKEEYIQYGINYDGWMGAISKSNKFTEDDLVKAYEFAKDWPAISASKKDPSIELKYDPDYKLLLIEEFILKR